MKKFLPFLLLCGVLHGQTISPSSISLPSGSIIVGGSSGTGSQTPLGTGVGAALINGVNASGGFVTVGATPSYAVNSSNDPQFHTVPSNSVMLVFGDSTATSYSTGANNLTWEYYLSLLIPNMTITSFAVPGTASGPVGTANTGLYIMNDTSGGLGWVTWSNGTITTGNTPWPSKITGFTGDKWAMANYGINDDLATSGISSGTFLTNMQSIYGTLHANGMKVIGATILPTGGAANLQPTFSDQILQNGQPYVATGTSTWDIMTDIAATLPNPYDTVMYASDQKHPTAMGNMAYAMTIYRTITNQSYQSHPLAQNGPVFTSTGGQVTVADAANEVGLYVNMKGGGGTPIQWANGPSILGQLTYNGGLNLTDSTYEQILNINTNGGNGNFVYFHNGGTTEFLIDGTGHILNCNGATITGAISETGTSTFAGPINSTSSQTAIAGSVSGTITCSQPLQGASYKKAIFYSNAFSGTGTYTFPVAFVNAPSTNELLLPSGLTATISTTNIIFTGTGTSGTGSAEGY